MMKSFIGEDKVNMLKGFIGEDRIQLSKALGAAKIALPMAAFLHARKSIEAVRVRQLQVCGDGRRNACPLSSCKNLRWLE